ncbi:unnamed protein product [Psylliodes chrysocephalus]|uniref:Folylpolyglutamate synthase n=1 Tax=Psylliodes chrysocephalus TaxID=3402493 RepID=A0A9P0GJK7_9CUCU|nr:unnamed protein product [Psylliodes chrysocephala]
MKVSHGKIITTFERYFSHAVKVLESNMSAKNYQGAIEALNAVQTNKQYLTNAAKRPKSETNISEVTKFIKRTGLTLEDLDKLSVIHVTGTNGKGTTCAYSEQILRNHGYTTGFFSSPHLLDVRERIRLNGKPISKAEFSNYFWKIYESLNSQKEHDEDMPLYFRFLTIMAFYIFLDNKVDVAILEVGIGGEYDCTNVIRNTKVAGITPLDMDHTALLGNSLESIAWNKSGIMKEGCAAFTTNQSPNVLKVFQERSIEKKCTLQVVDNVFGENNANVPINVTKTNASLALALTEAFMKKDTNNNFKKFDLALAKKSIQEAQWPGRYEIKQYNNLTFYLDGAHTLDSCRVCRDWYLSHTEKSSKKKCLIFNLTGERDPCIFFNELEKCGFDIIMFIPNVGGLNDKADTADLKFPEDKQLLKCQENKMKWLEMKKSSNYHEENVEVFASFSNALDFLKKSGEYDTLVTGSILLIGAALSVLDPTLNGALDD